MSNPTTTEIPIEDFSHLLNGSEYENGNESLHFSQMVKKPISVMLYFWIPRSKDDTLDLPMRLASVRIPGGVPVSKVRGMVNYIEEKLSEIFETNIRRANFVLRINAEDPFGKWELFYDLPLHGVYYV